MMMFSPAEIEEIVGEAYSEADAKYPKNEGQGHFERLLIEATIHAIEKRLGSLGCPFPST